MADTNTTWTQADFQNASDQEKLIRTVKEQIIPAEAENRVKAANGKASIYYVYGRPKTGGKIIVKNSDGINTVEDKVLLGTFSSEEEARTFQALIDSKVSED